MTQQPTSPNKWATYLGHDRPLPMGEQSHREYHSGDPDPFGDPCPDCGELIEEDDRIDSWTDRATGDRYHADCELHHDKLRCRCDMCAEDRAQ